MSRWLALAALGAAFVAMPALGRGGAARGFGGHVGFASHGPGFGGHGMMGGPAFGSFHGGWGHSPGFRPNPWRGGNHIRIRTAFPGRRYPFGGGYGYPWWNGWYDDYADSGYAQPYPAGGYADDFYAQNNDALAEQVGRLSDEVARLRGDRQAPVAQRDVATMEPAEPTTLIFRDKHTEEIENYAIVGPTLWILNPQRPRKIALAALDVPATIKANEDRGVDFQLPR